MNDNIRTVVVDASVVAKWIFTDEGDCIEALNLKNDIEDGRLTVLAPKLLLTELMSLLSVGVRRNRISSKDARMVLKYLLDIGILYVDESMFLTDSLELSVGSQLSLYDSVYVALAQLSRSPLYTADRRLIMNAERLNDGALCYLARDIGTYPS